MALVDELLAMTCDINELRVKGHEAFNALIQAINPCAFQWG